MTPELKEEILGSESFEDFCSKNVSNCDEIILRTAIVADKFYTVKMAAEKAKIEKLKKCLFNTLQDVSNNDLLDEISSTLKEIEE